MCTKILDKLAQFFLYQARFILNYGEKGYKKIKYTVIYFPESSIWFAYSVTNPDHHVSDIEC